MPISWFLPGRSGAIVNVGVRGVSIYRYQISDTEPSCSLSVFNRIAKLFTPLNPTGWVDDQLSEF